MNSMNAFSKNDLEISELLHTIDDLNQLEKQQIKSKALGEDTSHHNPREEELEKQGFIEGQIQEIMLGTSQQLPIHYYARDYYNWKQMREIRLGLLENIDISLYENPLFSAEQMQEIRLGLIDELDVSPYAKLIYTATDMSKIRRRLLAEIYETNPLGFAKNIVDEDTGIQIRISDNCMEAYMTITEFKDYSVMELKRILLRHEVVSGILEEQLESIVQNQTTKTEILIAKGIPVTQGENGRYEYFFNKLLPESPKERPDGSINYTNVIVAEKVKKGDVLAIYHPSTAGTSGETVTGVVLEGKHGNELPLLSGKGLKRDPKKYIFTATQDGLVFLDEVQYTLNIWNVFVVEGEINRYNGNITYDGTIHIMGSISDMAEITANGDVIVEGFVEGARITAGGNVILKKGINAGGEGYIHAGNKVMGNFFEYANIVSRGNIEGNYFLGCNITTDGTLLARGSKARIMGGNICAGKSVESVNIGNLGGAKTNIDVGNIAWINERMSKIQKTYNKVSEELQNLMEGKAKLHNILGEDLLESNQLFQKTCLAIQIKEEQQISLERDLYYFTNLRNMAAKAYVRVSGKLQEGVVVSVNGHKRMIQETMRGVTLRKPKNKNT